MRLRILRKRAKNKKDRQINKAIQSNTVVAKKGTSLSIIEEEPDQEVQGR